MAVMDARVVRPSRTPRVTCNLFRRSIIPSIHMLECDGTTEDEDVFRTHAQTSEEDECAIAHRPWAPLLRVGSRPVGSRSCHVREYRSVSRREVVAAAGELHERLGGPYCPIARDWNAEWTGDLRSQVGQVRR